MTGKVTYFLSFKHSSKQNKSHSSALSVGSESISEWVWFSYGFTTVGATGSTTTGSTTTGSATTGSATTGPVVGETSVGMAGSGTGIGTVWVLGDSGVLYY